MNGPTDLLVSYPWRHFGRARKEIVRRLREWGDAEPRVEKTRVPGIAVAHTSVNGKDVIRRCRERFEAGEPFEFAVKWLPVDAWSESSLDAMKAVIEERIKPRITPGQTWAMRVEKRGWHQYHTSEIIDRLASSIDRKVDLRHPDWIVRIDVLGPATAVSLLKPDEIFSIRAPRMPPTR